MVYLWRAVDAEGEVLDVLVQPTRNKAGALKLMRGHRGGLKIRKGVDPSRSSRGNVTAPSAVVTLDQSLPNPLQWGGVHAA
jgi:DDE superfamily endonuclease